MQPQVRGKRLADNQPNRVAQAALSLLALLLLGLGRELWMQRPLIVAVWMAGSVWLSQMARPNKSQRLGLGSEAVWTLAAWGPQAGLPIGLLGVGQILTGYPIDLWLLSELSPALLALAAHLVCANLGTPWNWFPGAIAALLWQAWLCRLAVQNSKTNDKMRRLRLENNLQPLRWASWWLLLLPLLACTQQESHDLWYLLGFLPGLLALQWGGQNGLFRVQAEQAAEAIQQFHRDQAEFRKLHRERERFWQQQHKLHSDTFLTELARQPNLESAMELVAQRMQPWTSLALIELDGTCRWVQSPQKEKIANRSLWKQQAFPDSQEPQLLAEEWLTGESAILLPCAGCWIYFGLASELQPKRKELFSRAVETVLSAESLVRHQLSLVRSKDSIQRLEGISSQLQTQVGIASLLLNHSERFGQVVDLEQLWNVLQQSLHSYLEDQLSWLAWLECGRVAVQSGSGLSPGPEVVQWASGVVGTAYLAQVDRARWPLPIPYDNLLVLGQPLGCLCLAFTGSREIDQAQLHFIQATHQLFLASLQRLQLQQQLLDSRRLYLEAQSTSAQAQFVAGVAHELNSPLGAIRLSLEATNARRQDARLEAALSACARAQAIITKLFDLSLQEKGQPQWVDALQFLKTYFSQHFDAASGKNVKWLGQDPLWMWGDRVSLERLLQPILKNAFEAGGPIEIDWSGQNPGTPGPPTWISVRDYGSGIAPEHRERVTEPFFTTKNDGQHLGLGLAMAKQACSEIRADLTFEHLTDGTRVRLLFSAPPSNDCQ